jgi:hypothetical protein
MARIVNARRVRRCVDMTACGRLAGKSREEPELAEQAVEGERARELGRG